MPKKNMISYELAKKLKDAGFPQQPSIDISGIDGQFFGSFYYLVKPGIYETAPNFLNEHEWEAKGQVHSDTPTETVKIPILSELITQIRNLSLAMPHWGRIFNLEGHWLHDFGYKAELIVIVNIEPGEEKVWEEWGQTPEEAVSLLWLSIQKK